MLWEAVNARKRKIFLFHSFYPPGDLGPWPSFPGGLWSTPLDCSELPLLLQGRDEARIPWSTPGKGLAGGKQVLGRRQRVEERKRGQEKEGARALCQADSVWAEICLTLGRKGILHKCMKQPHREGVEKKALPEVTLEIRGFCNTKGKRNDTEAFHSGWQSGFPWGEG